MKFLAYVLLFLTISVSIIYPASLTTRTVYGRTTMNADFQSVPSSPTTLTSVDSWIFQIVLANSTSGALTVTIQDKQGTPVCILCSVSLPANTTYIVPFPEGLKFESGITWSASGSGVNAAIAGWTSP